MGMVTRFYIKALRRGGSVFGPAVRPVKGPDGRIMYFDTYEEAEAQAAAWRSEISSGNVAYSVTECEGDTAMVPLQQQENSHDNS